MEAKRSGAPKQSLRSAIEEVLDELYGDGSEAKDDAPDLEPNPVHAERLAKIRAILNKQEKP